MRRKQSGGGTLDWFVNIKKTKVGDGSSSSPISPTEEESQFDVNSLSHDPGLRKSIHDYHPNLQDAVRREYIQRGPCQTFAHDFPQTNFVGKLRRFNSSWFKKYYWLEYSVEKDAAFCFFCYLFNHKEESNGMGWDAFIRNGFKGWNRPNAFDKHVGKVNSLHNQAREKYEALTRPKTSIQNVFDQRSSKDDKEYRVRLFASLSCVRYLLHQGLAFRGHNESQDSSNKGNFLELLEWLAKHKEDVDKVVLQNAPKNHKMIAPLIQRDLIQCCAKETTEAIINDLDGDYFSILVDESSDVSHKEQMALCLRYVGKKGDILERFLGVLHVKDTTALSLRDSIHSLLADNCLSPSKIRGQGYDGASNMKGELSGLKTLIMQETSSAYYVHCFAHQLQLTLVAVSKKSIDCRWLFEQLTNLLNVVGVSCKRKEMLREMQAQQVKEALDNDELESGKGLNQQLGLGRPGDTRWGSYYKLISNVIDLYPVICKVLDKIGESSSSADDRLKADVVSYAIESFDFVFMAHLMKRIFGVANDLNVALQRKDQDIINAMLLVKSTKTQLQKMRDNEWESMFCLVSSFCEKNGVEVPNMESLYVPQGRKKRGQQHTKNHHHYRVELFLTIIDLQLQELNNRFDEVSMKLLDCMGSLNPYDKFCSFQKEKLLTLASFYPNEFPNIELHRLNDQLDIFINDMRIDDRFWGLKDVQELSKKLVELNKHRTFDHVYLLIKLVLILPVATASVERAFSAMTYVKNKLRNSIGDGFLNDCLVTYIEKDIFSKTSDENIVNRFQKLGHRRGKL